MLIKPVNLLKQFVQLENQQLPQKAPQVSNVYQILMAMVP